MELKPIRTEAEYDAALRQASEYFDSEPEAGTKAGDRFEVLVMLIEAYEAKHHSIAHPTP
jgi:HTH-type transcriptional regulator/antitoxin HigA